MNKQDTMTQLGRVLVGVCDDPKHLWTRIQGRGTKHVFEICMYEQKIKVNEGEVNDVR